VCCAFVAYLAAAIVDRVLRGGFLAQSSDATRPMSGRAAAAIGVVLA